MNRLIIRPVMFRPVGISKSVSWSQIHNSIVYGKDRVSGEVYLWNLDDGTVSLRGTGDLETFTVKLEYHKVLVLVQAEIPKSFSHYSDHQRYHEYLKRHPELLTYFKQAPAIVDATVRMLITQRANAVDLYLPISEHCRVPKFSCKPDQRTAGWYVKDQDGNRMNVEWLLNLVAQAPEK